MTKARDLANASTALSAVSATELGYVDGVTSAIQTQIDAKAPSSTAVTLTGTQTLTNKTLTSPVIASVVNNTLTSTTGDMIYASAANTPARLGIGSSAQVLTVSGGIPSWATASSGGMTLLSTTTLSGASTTISSISGSYTHLFAYIYGVTNATADGVLTIRPNSLTNISNTLNPDYTAGWSYVQDDVIKATIYFSGNEQNWFRTSSNNGIAFQIYNYSNTSGYKPFSLTGNYTKDAVSKFAVSNNGGIQTNSAITSLQFLNSGGNLSTGTVLLYGVK